MLVILSRWLFDKNYNVNFLPILYILSDCDSKNECKRLVIIVKRPRKGKIFGWWKLRCPLWLMKVTVPAKTLPPLKPNECWGGPYNWMVQKLRSLGQERFSFWKRIIKKKLTCRWRLFCGCRVSFLFFPVQVWMQKKTLAFLYCRDGASHRYLCCQLVVTILTKGKSW